jgi:glutathione S-transferase
MPHALLRIHKSVLVKTMLMLHHFPGAICAQKVRVALAEKNLSWESRSVLRELRSPDYLRVNPHGYVPTLVYDGQIARGLYPNVARWFAQVQARPSYETAILDWVMPEDDKRDRLNAAAAKPHLAAAWSAAES